MPRVSGKSKSGSLQQLGFTINTGHASSSLTIVSSIVSAAVDYAGQQILSNVDPNVSAPIVTDTQQDQLQQIEVFSSLDIPDQETGELVEVKQVVETIEVVSETGEAEITETAGSGSQKLTQTVSSVTTNVEVKLVKDDDLIVLHTEFLRAFLELGPFMMGSMETYSRLWNMLNDKINDMPIPDIRLLIYRDSLDALIKARNVYVDNKRTDKEITVVRNKYKASQDKVAELMEQLALCKDEEGLARFCGALGIRVKQPRPLIYAQALFNLNMAWHIYLHGTPIDPRMFQSTISYVSSFESKDAAYQKLITLLDEFYKDDELEMETIAQEIKDKHSSSSEQTSSGPETSSSSSGRGSSETCSSSDLVTSDSNYSSSEVYTSGSEYYYSDEELEFDKAIPGFNTISNYKQEPTFVNLFGQGLMLVMDGRVAIDVQDKYEHGRRELTKRMKKRKKKTYMEERVARGEAFYLPAPKHLGGGQMLVMSGALGIDVADRFERHITQSKNRKKTRRHKKKKKKSKHSTSKVTNRFQEINQGDVMYKPDLFDWNKPMLVLGGQLGIDVSDRFERHKLKEEVRKSSCKPSESIHEKHKLVNTGTVYTVPDPTGGAPMLILGGELGIDIADRFEKHRLEKIRKKKTRKVKKEKKSKEKKSKHKKSSKKCKDKKSSKTKKHDKLPTYLMFDFFGTTNAQSLLILPGCIDVDMIDKFTTFKGEESRQTQPQPQHVHTEACGVEVEEATDNEYYQHPGTNYNEPILSQYVDDHPHH